MTNESLRVPTGRRHNELPTGGFLSCGECSTITATALALEQRLRSLHPHNVQK